MISGLKEIFGSNSKSQEIALLLAHEKPVCRQCFYEYELPGVERFCREKRLFLVRSNFRVRAEFDNSYSNRGVRVSKDDKEALVIAYISFDELSAYQACYFEQKEDHRNLGRLLGYPPCCIGYFMKAFSSGDTDPMQESDNPFTDISKRGEDIVLLSHFPCRAGCEESIALGKRYLEALGRIDPEYAKGLFASLARRR